LKAAFGDGAQHVTGLATKRFALKLDVMLPVPVLEQLLCAEREKHTEDDDPDLTDELAPAVQRLR